MSEQNLQPADVAGKTYSQFERCPRNGTTDEYYVRVKDGAPDWITETVEKAHAASGTLYLPCDWIYETTREAFGMIADAGADDLDDLQHEFADGVDVYSGALSTWLKDYPGARAACEEANSELGPIEGGDVDKLLQLGQYVARGQIFAIVAEAVDSQVER